ncbi:hypothetical protein PIROE2DRAFT_14654 [Piromyces sp. E2]|nr:hypothetical protein PIROE2DRAFT_14654 [Piromyces sp. E2]|eukprot:OUM59751.1 hypothetical protein PIROE2DRAFT_14654 [Piromyces sp. E2]
MERSGNSFLKKFKQISEYRIILSIFFYSLWYSINIFTYASYVYYSSKTTPTMDSEEKINAVNNMVNDSVIDPIRTMILNFSYIFMYIDQIMLRFYTEEKQRSTKMSSSNSSYIKFSSNIIYVGSSNYNGCQIRSINQSTPDVSYTYNATNDSYETYTNNNNNVRTPKPSHHSIPINDTNDTAVLNPKYNVNYIGYYNYEKL